MKRIVFLLILVQVLYTLTQAQNKNTILFEDGVITFDNKVLLIHENTLGASSLVIDVNQFNFVLQKIESVSFIKYKNTLDIHYNENIGNDLVRHIHCFSNTETIKRLELQKEYVINTNRQGITILCHLLYNPLPILRYEEYNSKSYKELGVYLFSGFQDNEEPNILGFYELIKYQALNNQKDSIDIYGNINVIKALVEEIEIDKNNVQQYNDIAYYLEQSSLFDSSIFILEKIVKHFPTRVVAYLNLADAYWEIEDKNKAIENYNKYIELMKEKGWENKIPKRVYDKANAASFLN